ncbi:MAG TPA: paraquat-inducible protein A [Victivallales bacterium]|nr:paraquat-inducible protein A [Victivallales bacterium]
MNNNKPLCIQYPIITLFVSVILLTSLILNIAALLVPFIQISPFIKSDLIYTLPTSMILLWDHGLYLIAILVFSFSIIFPFIKLTAMFYAWYISSDHIFRNKLISRIETLGKWSMLDVFIICIMLILTNNQFWISSAPQIGIYFFLFAIILSIICSILIDILCMKSNKISISKRKEIILGTLNIKWMEKSLIILAIIIGIVFLFLALNNSYIAINSYFFTNYSYSVINSIISLWPVSNILSIFFIVVLVAAPLINIFSLLIFWVMKYRPKFHYSLLLFMKKVAKFSMLDVFCLALLLFLTEGNRLMKTDLKTGLIMLEMFAFIYLFIPNIINFTIMKSIRNNNSKKD